MPDKRLRKVASAIKLKSGVPLLYNTQLFQCLHRASYQIGTREGVEYERVQDTLIN